jgi:hypothetical protein
MLNEHFEARRDHSARIWRLLMFELWQRNFLEKLSPTGAIAGSYQTASVSGDNG